MEEQDVLRRTAILLHPRVREWLEQQGAETPVAVHVTSACAGEVASPEALALLIYNFYVEDVPQPVASEDAPAEHKPTPSAAGLELDLGLALGSSLVLLGLRQVGEDVLQVSKLLAANGRLSVTPQEILYIINTMTQKPVPPAVAQEPFPDPWPFQDEAFRAEDNFDEPPGEDETPAPEQGSDAVE